MAEDGKEKITDVQVISQTPVSDSKNFGIASNCNVLDNGLQRSLKKRHLVMISFGGIMGSSVWYGVGAAIADNGPVGALICFMIIGVDVFFVMQALGKTDRGLLQLDGADQDRRNVDVVPYQGAFLEMAGRFVDESLAFSVGWQYWYTWVTNIANDMNTTSLVLMFWTTAVPSYGWIMIWWFIFSIISLLGVVVWGEIEFWLACWKLLCVFGGFLCSILINTGAVGSDHIGFRFWAHPGPFANGIHGWGKSFILAAVYYSGTEMLALTAGESRNPTRDLTSAVRQTFYRILFIFVGLVFFAGIIVPSNSPSLLSADSKTALTPWTIAFIRAGVPAMAQVVNVVLLTSAFSSMNSQLYVSSRTLVSLANSGRAPKFLGWTTKEKGTPIVALLLCNTLGLVSILNYHAGPGKVFGYFTNISGLATFIAWAVIGVVHIRFRGAWTAQGHTLDELPFKAMFYPYGTLFVIALNIFLVFVSGFEAFVDGFHVVDFMINYIVIAVFIVLFVGWKLIKKTKFKSLSEIDLFTGRRAGMLYQETLDEERAQGPPWYVKVKRRIMR